MSGLSNIVCSLVVFLTSQIASLPLSKLCYLTDITSGPSRVITSGECGLKCGSKEGCMTFITCDLAYSKTCTIYKIASKETCGEEGVDCSYFVQKTVPSDSDEIVQSLQHDEDSVFGSPLAKTTTTTILKTITTTSIITTYPGTSKDTNEQTESTSQQSTTAKPSESSTTQESSTSNAQVERSTTATILSQTLGITSSAASQDDTTTSSYDMTTQETSSYDVTTQENSSLSNVKATTTEMSSTSKTADCPDHVPEDLCQTH